MKYKSKISMILREALEYAGWEISEATPGYEVWINDTDTLNIGVRPLRSTSPISWVVAVNKEPARPVLEPKLAALIAQGKITNE